MKLTKDNYADAEAIRGDGAYDEEGDRDNERDGAVPSERGTFAAADVPNSSATSRKDVLARSTHPSLLPPVADLP
jgi:hypothetical protein